MSGCSLDACDGHVCVKKPPHSQVADAIGQQLKKILLADFLKLHSKKSKALACGSHGRGQARDEFQPCRLQLCEHEQDPLLPRGFH